MADNPNSESRGDYSRGYYDKYGKWVEYSDIGRWARRRRAPGPALVLGILMILLGVLLFLDNVGLFNFRDVWRFWPVALIAVGVAKLSESREGVAGRVWASMLIVAGACFLLSSLHIWYVNWNMMWPLALVGFGIMKLVGALEPRAPEGGSASTPDGVISSGGPSPGAAFSGGTSPENTMREWVTFGGIKRKFDTQNFRGGEAVAVFGGIEVDLRRAGIAPGNHEVIIDANATFGGIDIRVPENWRVMTRGVGIFGGYEDKTIPPRPQEGVDAPKLIIKGYALFGGITVKN
jgi:Domain of unknown function (DUF5668)/Cell wall-active antibiotics response 4TMS YvqF